MNELELFDTIDGSHSLYHRELDETYHSKHGAIQESAHVFIKHGLDFVLQTHQQKSIAVLEIGFGTGLNALLSLRYAIANQVEIDYCAIEPYPVDVALALQLNYAAETSFENSDAYFEQLHKVEWDRQNSLATLFKFLKLRETIQSVNLSPNKFDVIYFDAFAPEKQPEMWTVDVLAKVAEALKPNGVFVTYCVKGQLRRDLRALNLKVEKLSGPPGKREMTRAIKQ